MERHARLWRVHNAWAAQLAARSALPASAEPAESPAPAAAAMDVARGTKRTAEQADERPSEVAAKASVGGGDGLNAAASEFSPGLPMAEVEAAWKKVFGVEGPSEEDLEDHSNLMRLCYAGPRIGVPRRPVLYPPRDTAPASSDDDARYYGWCSDDSD